METEAIQRFDCCKADSNMRILEEIAVGQKVIVSSFHRCNPIALASSVNVSSPQLPPFLNPTFQLCSYYVQLKAIPPCPNLSSYPTTGRLPPNAASLRCLPKPGASSACAAVSMSRQAAYAFRRRKNAAQNIPIQCKLPEKFAISEMPISSPLAPSAMSGHRAASP